VGDARAAIERLLAGYLAALNRMDQKAVRAIDPQSEEVPLPSGTPFVATASDVTITVGADGETATLRGRLEFTGADGRPLSASRDLRWSLRRNGSTWMVVP
jgi:hypothetical protein